MSTLITLPFIISLFAIAAFFIARSWSKPGTIMAEFILPSSDVVTRKTQTSREMEGHEARFNIGETSYLVPDDADYIKRVRVAFGLVTVPKLYYFEGIANPINLRKLKIGDTITAERLHTSQENHVARDLIRAMVQEVFTPATMLVIAVGAALAGNAWLYFQFNGRLKEIETVVKLFSGVTP